MNKRFFYHDFDRLLSINSNNISENHCFIEPLKTFYKGEIKTIKDIDISKLQNYFESELKAIIDDGNLFYIYNKSPEYKETKLSKFIFTYFDFEDKVFKLKDFSSSNIISLNAIKNEELEVKYLCNIYNDNFKTTMIEYPSKYKEWSITVSAIKLLADELLSYYLNKIKDINLIIPMIMKIPRIHSLSVDEWVEFRIKLITDLYENEELISKPKKGSQLEYFFEDYLYSKSSGNHRKIAFLESLITDK